MSSLDLSGALTAGPATGSGFPAASFTVPLALIAGASSSFQVASGVLTQLYASPAAFVALGGVGPTAAVTQGQFLYLKCDAASVLRITTDDGSGGTAVVEVPVHGLVLIEFPALRPLELLEIKGTGKVEYLVCGAS